MKRICLLAVTLTALAVACQKNGPGPSPDMDRGVSLTIGIRGADLPSPLSKAEAVTGSEEENTVTGIQVFVFKKNGNDYLFETSAKASGSTATLTVTSGTKTIIVLANEDTDFTLSGEAVLDRSALYAQFRTLKAHRTGHFQMMGEKSGVTIGNTSATATCTVPMSRLVSRVEIKKITNSLQYGYAGEDVSVVRAFLTGVPEKVNFGVDPNHPDVAGMLHYDSFYATTGINTRLDLNGEAVPEEEKTAVNALIYKSVNSDVLADGASCTQPVVLYTCPNDLTHRATHVVVELRIGGKYYTYPVELPRLEPNCTYQINELVIKSIGNPGNGDDQLDGEEDLPITHVDCTFSVEVQPWTLTVLSNGDDGKWTI